MLFTFIYFCTLLNTLIEYKTKGHYIWCISNIISNAKKYAKSCTILLERNEDVILITMDDDGLGIDEAKREDVFKPFYRVEESRNHKTGGVGLGLPIAQDIILAHGGLISLGDNPQGGLRVFIELPV